MKKKLAKLSQLLSFIPEGKGLDLAEDTFLTGRELDGSDKLYGFKKEDGELLAITRQANDGFPISDLDKEDLNYIFNLSAPNIATKIENKKYEIVDADDI